jgi:hypothetical protein
MEAKVRYKCLLFSPSMFRSSTVSPVSLASIYLVRRCLVLVPLLNGEVRCSIQKKKVENMSKMSFSFLKCGLHCTDFYELRATQRDCVAICAEFEPSRSRSVGSTGINLFTPSSKVWLSLRRLSQSCGPIFSTNRLAAGSLTDGRTDMFSAYAELL